MRDVSTPIIIDATDWKTSEAADRVWSLDPGMVGITVMGYTSVQPALRFLRILTRRNKARTATIVVGGHGARGASLSFLKAGAAAVITGEGESALRSIITDGVIPGASGIECLSNGKSVPGGKTRLIQPLDLLPSPARDLMPIPKDGIHLLETSRGCPHRCAFCETTLFHGNSWRGLSPERVSTEVKCLIRDYGAWTILVADDNFAASPSRVIEICKCLRSGALPAMFVASARADDLLRDSALIPAMASARILRLTVGVETLDFEAAADVGKPISLPAYQEAFARLRENGIFSIGSFIVGLPGQRSDYSSFVQSAVDAGPDAAVFVPFIPMPGTPLAVGRTYFRPYLHDAQRAKEMTKMFFLDARVRRRLSEAEAKGGMRGLMARSTIIYHTGLSRSAKKKRR